MQDPQTIPLYQPAATVAAALISFAAGFIAAEINRRQKADELFFKALDFLRGGTQNRNLGLSAIELYWSRKRHRSVAASLLVGSAIYLLRESKHDSAHERYNLKRIMALLFEDQHPGKGLARSYAALCSAVKDRIGGAKGGIEISPSELSDWEGKLEAMGVCPGQSQ